MAYEFKDPNALYEFADKENASFDELKVLEVQAELQAIETNFVATAEQPTCDTFCMTAEYNKANVGEEINGTTAQFCLTYSQEEAV